jgi:beta-phosphoglucomutase-like phosphatase (HAD superfamily)
VEPFPDLRAFLDELQAAGVDVCICSSTRLELVRQWIDRHRIAEYFRIVDGWLPERDKAAQVHSLLDRSARSADRCLVVSDSRRDGLLAASMGMRFRGVLRPGTSNLEGSGFAYAADLRSISAAIATRRRLAVVTLPDRLDVGATGSDPGVHDPERVGEDRQYRVHPAVGDMQRAVDDPQVGMIPDPAVRIGD